MSKKITILIDESGTLPDPNDKVVVLAAVGTGSLDQFEKLLKKVHIIIKRSGDRPDNSEIKFYSAGQRTKKYYLKALADLPVSIFILIVNKPGQKIPDTPLNFSLLAYILLNEVLGYTDNVEKVVFDRHFQSQTERDKFDTILLTLLGKKIQIEHADSQTMPSVNVADMVAGSALWAHTGKDRQYYELISGKIVSEVNLHWAEAKKMVIHKIKKFLWTGASTHPEELVVKV